MKCVSSSSARVYFGSGLWGEHWDRLSADAQAGLFDALVVWQLDRMGRSLQHLLSVLDDLAGWAWISRL